MLLVVEYVPVDSETRLRQSRGFTDLYVCVYRNECACVWNECTCVMSVCVFIEISVRALGKLANLLLGR